MRRQTCSPRTPGDKRLRAAALFLVALQMSAVSGAVAETIPLARIVPDYMEGELETAIIPTPQQADLKDSAFNAGRILLVTPERYDAGTALCDELRRLFGSAQVDVIDASAYPGPRTDTVIFAGRPTGLGAWSDLVKAEGLQPWLDEAAGKGADGYVLFTGGRTLAGRNAVVLAGNTPAADFWALATLRQMTFPHGDAKCIREGRILDFPRFAYRGNKRPEQWEWRYKANYAWSFSQPNFPSKVERKTYHRGASAWIHYGSPLRATDAEMDQLIAGYQNSDRKGRVAGARECYAQGCREFVLKFDDSGSQLSPATEKQFSDGDPRAAYFKALNYFLVGMHRRIRALDPGNRVYFMPRPYWYNSFEQPEFAARLLEHGPLPKDMGLSVCGPEVISWTIPTACLKDFRELYGLAGKAQIYDNFGRGGEYFAYTGRDKDLWREVECVFPERGTPVTRITVYDYLWNPEAYDADRSLRLAVRELADRDPQLYRTMWNYVEYYNRNRDFADYPSRQHVAETLPEVNRQMQARFEALVPLLARSALAEECHLKSEFWGPESPRPAYEVGEYARLRRRLEFASYLLAYGYREGEVEPTAETVVVDGRLDEAAWKTAKPFPDFVRPAWSGKENLADLAAMQIPAEESTCLKMLYSSTHLYFAAEFRYQKKPTLPGWAENLWKDVRPGERANLAWRVPCIEILLDATGRRELYDHVVSNIAGLWVSTRCRAFQPRETGGWWNPRWQFQFNLDETSGVFEASIPLSDLTDAPPRPGAIWGFQAYRSHMGPFGLMSGCCDLVGGEHGTRQWGRIVFR